MSQLSVTDRPGAATPAGRPAAGQQRRRRSTLARREAWTGLLWVQAWLLGFVLFTAGPILGALYLAFTDWKGSGVPRFVGLQNFIEIFTADPLFWQSLKVTGIFALLYLPASLLIGLGMAMLMNQKLIGVRVFRTIYYLPSVLSGVAVAILWNFVFHREYGILNGFIGLFGVPPVPWLQDPRWVLPALVIMQLWGVGSSVIIYLGGLQGIPSELYEVAKIDGAGWWHTLRNITLPMMSPVIFFQLVLGLIATFQVFTQAYVMTGGGPDYGSYFYALSIYNRAFVELRLGYASALSVVLFVIIVAVTGVIFKTSKAWVYYAGESR
ncbi:carbohydrate ABC transporter permease [Microlunatus soli]|uniref:Carbohydrate ABC transporter membrane protein 1, CUT1 family n=1 Tax=Microlunatus soli TaxID=630515 RepID=A0A1H1RM94_9ACTN|nr:sugar ABC transporter permease [Microlunatus soli]SDS36818.1 carbohydrate ABC transporter membrane protein 1, CUT1 family [Microlunatus soli]